MHWNIMSIMYVILRLMSMWMMPFGMKCSQRRRRELCVNMYPFALYRKDNVIQKDGLNITTKLRTLVDLHCDDKAYAGELLVMQLWPWKK